MGNIFGDSFGDAVSSIQIAPGISDKTVNTLGTDFASVYGGNDSVLGRLDNWFSGSTERDRAKSNEDMTTEQSYYDTYSSLANSEKSMYDNIAYGTDSGISAEQQASIDTTERHQRAQLLDAMNQRGMGMSSAALTGESAIQSDKIHSEESTKFDTEKTHWDNFIAAEGVAYDTAMIMAGISATDRSKAMELYSATMSLAGGTAGVGGTDISKSEYDSGYESIVKTYTDSSSSSFQWGINSGTGNAVAGSTNVSTTQ